ncbi:MAG: metallophosphoesterase, partial [Henriciella sp.]
LGDYIDRGLESKQVVDFLLDDPVQKFDPIFIKGNHEEALLNFLEDPRQGPVWARFGGRETLVSYGVRPPRGLSFSEDWIRAHREFKDIFPETHMQFLRRLKASARIGKFGFAHAGIRPGVPFEEQSEKDLLWIRDEFLKSKAELDVCLIHGHTPVDQATVENNRINVDTGAYYSGRLTAVRLIGDDISFISTRP